MDDDEIKTQLARIEASLENLKMAWRHHFGYRPEDARPMPEPLRQGPANLPQPPSPPKPPGTPDALAEYPDRPPMPQRTAPNAGPPSPPPLQPHPSAKQ